MPTRFNSRSVPRFNVPGLPTGYDGTASGTSLSIPAVGIEDVDAALFNLFDKELTFQVSTSDKNREDLKRVPVIFSSAEKWALAKRSRGLRDLNGSLILPLITVIRTTIQQTPVDDITGRGVNQQTGEIVIRRRLDRSDRGYQNLINRLSIDHQSNLAVATGRQDDGQLSTLRATGDLVDDPVVVSGGLMVSDRKNNVFETLVVPAPQFFTSIYEVTFWSQYTVQMVQLLETLITSFLPQGNAWQLNTPNGYWFIATVDGNVYNSENNADDMSQEERIIKHKFTVKVPGYILASKVPGAPIPIKRYVSSPTVSFDVGLNAGEQPGDDSIDDPFLGADDPTLPMTDSGGRRRDQRRVGQTRLYPNVDDVPADDPARTSVPRGQALARYKKVKTLGRNGKEVISLVRVTSTNRFTGETTFAPGVDLGGLTIVVDD